MYETVIIMFASQYYNQGTWIACCKLGPNTANLDPTAGLLLRILSDFTNLMTVYLNLPSYVKMQ